MREALRTWFEAAARPLPWRAGSGSAPRDPYRTLIVETMAQQTRIETVVARLDAFLARFPDLATLAAADLDDVLHAWSGLGYYRRARALHALARTVVEAFDGRLPARPGGPARAARGRPVHRRRDRGPGLRAPRHRRRRQRPPGGRPRPGGTRPDGRADRARARRPAARRRLGSRGRLRRRGARRAGRDRVHRPAPHLRRAARSALPAAPPPRAIRSASRTRGGAPACAPGRSMPG